MRLWRRMRQRAEIGLALGRDRLTAVTLGRRSSAGDETWSRPLEPCADGRTGWSDLVPALEELRELTGLARARLRVSLLPPLVQTKRIELPRLRADELRRILTRDVGRYFSGRDAPRVVAVAPCGQGRRSPWPYLVCATDSGTLDALYSSVGRIGWTVESVAPAYPAWQMAATRKRPELRRGDGWVAIDMDCRIERLRLERGRLAEIRRFREADRASALEAADVTMAGDSIEVLAARYASYGRDLDLVPEDVRDHRVRRSNRRSTRLVLGAAALLSLSAGVELWGAHRELRALEDRRVMLRSRVAEAMRAREQLDGLDARLRALAAAQASASRWALALTSTADHLPRTAYLVDLRGEADTLMMEGVAQQAAQVFEALGKAPGFVAVRAAAPIRQEAQDSGAAIERFTLSARLGSAALPAGKQ